MPFHNSDDDTSDEPVRDGPVFTEGCDEFSMEDAIVLTKCSRQMNNKYQVEQSCYKARLDVEHLLQGVRGDSAASVASSVRSLFTSLIRRTTESLVSSDLIQFCIQAEGLDKPISTSLMRVVDLTVEKVLSVVMKVVQSKEEIRLGHGFTVDVITIERPIGAGKTNRKVVNVQVDRLRKKSILSIPYDAEGLCCAKAIVFALAHLENDRTAIALLQDKRRPTLMNLARALHDAARVPLGPCTFSEIARFEDHLDLQIVVLSADNLDKEDDISALYIRF